MSNKEAMSYLDLLITTLQEHEKALSELVDRLERILGQVDADAKKPPCWEETMKKFYQELP